MGCESVVFGFRSVRSPVQTALVTLQLLRQSRHTKDLGVHVQRTLTGMGVGGTIRPTHYRLLGDPNSVEVCA